MDGGGIALHNDKNPAVCHYWFVSFEDARLLRKAANRTPPWAIRALMTGKLALK